MLWQARKETVQLERDLNRERRAKEDLESRLESVDRERQNLRREVEGLRDEVADLRTRADEDGERCDHNFLAQISKKHFLDQVQSLIAPHMTPPLFF